MSTIIDPARVPPTSACEIPAEQFWRISVENYHEMLRAGILQSGDPVELLEGWLVQKMPKNPPHVVAVRLMKAALEAILPGDWNTLLQDPITLEDSEPEPDVTLVRGCPRDYLQHHPGPADIGLIVEVAAASLLRDRNLKKRIYARAGIAEYWIVNLKDHQIEVYSSPTGSADEPDYLKQQVYTHEQSVTLRLDGQVVGQIAVSDLLP
jgi:Uma2 family endonuclease